jgi:anti-sigma regulatory factor (Ser/Thr protein kinase)
MSELLHLEHDLRAPTRARHWLRRACRAWGCTDLAPDAELLVDELTTNAVLHAGTGCRVEAEFDDPALWVGVDDGMSGDLSWAVPAVAAERGRGLMIVDALANAWGVAPTPTGKSVWFALWSPSLAEPRVRLGRLERWHPSLVPDSGARVAEASPDAEDLSS